MKYNSKGCHGLKELQKCFVSSLLSAISRARISTGHMAAHQSQVGFTAGHRKRDVSLETSLCPDPRVFLGSPGAHCMRTPEMRTRVTTVITGFGVKGGVELQSLQTMKSHPSPISGQLSGSGHGFTCSSLSDHSSPSPPSHSFCENRDTIRQEQGAFLEFLQLDFSHCSRWR